MLRNTKYALNGSLPTDVSPRAPRIARRSRAFNAHSEVARGLFSVLASFSDVLAIVATAILTGTLYHAVFYEGAAVTELYFQVGFFIAVLFVVPNIMRGEYQIARYLSFKNHFYRSLLLWNIAFICALALGFVTKSTAQFSRGAILGFFASGFATLIITRFIMVGLVKAHAHAGSISTRRVCLVGAEEDINAFSERYQPWKLGMRVVTASVLRGPGSLNDDLALAAASARILRPDDIFILVPWSKKEVIDSCVNAFLRVPASIHLGPERVLERFADARISKIGPISSLHLARRPLNLVEVSAKRLFDIFASLTALILLSPLLAVFALLIRLDSKGPAFFIQRRYGFNQQPFRIFKFRSMSTMEDHAELTATARVDHRVTRIGAFMRRWNIDELPQLINVLKGDMSLVGPRPHALAHDQLFERTTAMYARRHNVKPGITGWAQVNGYRGTITSDERIQGRIERDLYYIDNWSFWLDLRILWLTIASSKAYRNAY